MAKKPKKAPAADGEEGSGEAPKSKKKLIIIAAAVLLLGGGGGGFFFMKSRAAHADHGEHGAEKLDPKAQAVFLDMRDMLVNLSPDPGATKANVLKLRVALELKDAKVEATVKPLMPRVEDAFQTYLREIRASDLAGSAGLYRLREELLRRVNIALHPAKAEAVLFKDVIVQ
ncbi:flagellar basal body-associated protein FliL [Methylobacterium sp. J-043]|uniref:flagellar basal body-associated protein FliL n=1 Tax=Methylorubrum TaxID=2282523 RepID=UPI0020A2239A|nr:MULTISPECIES: flagellar basal body-associated protein FliL [Methylorubrum]MCJ2032250.1 flagellar basal body-associated protein FliL [Methylobacterium sp. J-043]MCP1548939.1 flagellar FliL protein [Methylorubrum zatmanii]MCP1554448.1 flagellar FliL protein [Methylorubrum extorquens]MCP1579241.1 flagellar FliL protein [Methylorubrum extorquens]